MLQVSLYKPEEFAILSLGFRSLLRSANGLIIS